eukprot:SAG11_NODE_26256_length_347_cov_1.459677_1_plen_30_part_10
MERNIKGICGKWTVHAEGKGNDAGSKISS